MCLVFHVLRGLIRLVMLPRVRRVLGTRRPYQRAHQSKIVLATRDTLFRLAGIALGAKQEPTRVTLALASACRALSTPPRFFMA